MSEHDDDIMWCPTCGEPRFDVDLMRERDTLRADNARLWEALEKAYGVLVSIQGSRKGSIGSIGNTYLPQLNVTRIDKIFGEVAAALYANEESSDG